MSSSVVIEPASTPSAPTAQRPRGTQRLGIALTVISAAQLMVVLDGTIVNIALPHIKTDLGVHPGEPVMGRQRLHPGLRRPAAARRPRRRPLRPPQGVHGGRVAVRRRLAAGRHRSERGHAAGRPGLAGPRRGDGLPQRPGPDHDDLPGWPGAQPGDGRVRRDVRCGCSRRAHPRRCADRGRLALDLLHQRADRHAGRRPGSALPRRVRPRRGRFDVPGALPAVAAWSRSSTD